MPIFWFIIKYLQTLRHFHQRFSSASHRTCFIKPQPPKLQSRIYSRSSGLWFYFRTFIQLLFSTSDNIFLSYSCAAQKPSTFRSEGLKGALKSPTHIPHIVAVRAERSRTFKTSKRHSRDSRGGALIMFSALLLIF